MRRGQAVCRFKKNPGHHSRDAITVVVPVDFITFRVTFCAILASSPLQCLQAARRFEGSYHAPPRDTGCMWSTVFAVTVQPGSDIWQVLLSLANICLRTVGHCPP